MARTPGARQHARVARLDRSDGTDARPADDRIRRSRRRRTVGEEPAVARARAALVRRYGEAASSIRVGAETLDRLTVLARLGTEPDPAARRGLFEALAPVWRVVDGDGGDASPYRRLLRSSAERWRIAGSPVDANVASVGLPPEAFEPPAARHPGGLADRARSGPDRALGLPLRDRAASRRLDRPRARRSPPRAEPRLPARARRRSRRPRHPVRRPAAARASADPARVHAGHGRLGGRPAGRDGTLDASTAMGLRDLRDGRPGQPRRAAPRERSRDPRRGDPDPAGLPRVDRGGHRLPRRRRRRPGLGRHRAGLAASLAGRGGHDRRGRPRPVRRGDARHLLGAVRDRAAPPARPPPERRLDRDHGRRPGHRAPPRMVVVGDPRPAHRRPGLHGQLRPGGDHRGGGPGADPRGPRPVVGGRPGLVRRSWPTRCSRPARRGRPRTCSSPSSAGR